VAPTWKACVVEVVDTSPVPNSRRYSEEDDISTVLEPAELYKRSPVELISTRAPLVDVLIDPASSRLAVTVPAVSFPTSKFAIFASSTARFSMSAFVIAASSMIAVATVRRTSTASRYTSPVVAAVEICA
jgi:hypothetical protein